MSARIHPLEEYEGKTEDISIAEMTRQWFERGRNEMIEMQKRKNGLSTMSTSSWSLTANGSFFDDDSNSESNTNRQTKHLVIHYEDLIVVKTIGEGVSSFVKKVIHKPSGEVMAIKVLKPSREQDSIIDICRELTILRYSISPYFLEFYGATVYEGTNVIMLMEYMDLGSLESIRKNFGGTIPEHILGRIALPVLNGLYYLHHHFNILHRDIKPANILLNSKGEVKLTDFGVSEYMDETGKIRTSVQGTRAYILLLFYPECIAGEPYGELSDIWSFGITLYYCATGHFPYNLPASHGYWELFFSIRDEAILPLPDSFSTEFRDFINLCLERDLSKRAPIPRLLYHSFIQENRNVNLVEELKEIIRKVKEEDDKKKKDEKDENVLTILKDDIKKVDKENDEDKDDEDNVITIVHHDSLLIEESGSTEVVRQSFRDIEVPVYSSEGLIPCVAWNVYEQMKLQSEGLTEPVVDCRRLSRNKEEMKQAEVLQLSVNEELSEQSVQQLNEQSIQQSVQQLSEQSIQQSVQQLNEQSIQQSVQQLNEQSIQQLNEQSIQQSVQQLNEQSIQQSVQQLNEQSIQQSVQQLSEQSMQQLNEQSIQPLQLPPEPPPLQTVTLTLSTGYSQHSLDTLQTSPSSSKPPFLSTPVSPVSFTPSSHTSLPLLLSSPSSQHPSGRGSFPETIPRTPSLPEAILTDTLLIPPDPPATTPSFQPLSLQQIDLHTFIQQSSYPNWEGITEVSPHSIGSHDDSFSLHGQAESTRSGDDSMSCTDSLSESSCRSITQFRIQTQNLGHFSSQHTCYDIDDDDDDLEVIQDNHQQTDSQHYFIVDSDSFDENDSINLNPVISEKTPISLSEIQNPVFLYPKVSSERRLLDRMTVRNLSWKQRFIRSWNRFIRKLFRKNQRYSDRHHEMETTVRQQSSKQKKSCCWK